MKHLADTTLLSQLSPEELKNFLENLEDQNIEVRVDLKGNDLSVGAHFSTHADPKKVHDELNNLIEGSEFEIERWWDESNNNSEGFSVVVKKPIQEVSIKHAQELFNLASQVYKKAENV